MSRGSAMSEVPITVRIAVEQGRLSGLQLGNGLLSLALDGRDARQQALTADRSDPPLAQQFDDRGNDVERAVQTPFSDREAAATNERHTNGTGMPAGSAVGNRTNSAEVRMFEASRRSLPDDGQVSLRRCQREWVPRGGAFHEVDRALSGRGIDASSHEVLDLR